MKHSSPLLLLAWIISATAAEFTLRLTDEEGRPAEAASLRIVLDRRDDPRDSSRQLIADKSGADGKFSFSAAADMCLSRIDITKDGHYPCLIDGRHDICRFEEKQAYAFTIPRRIHPTALHAKKVKLRFAEGGLPEKTWLSYDFEKGDVLKPFGRGEIADIRFRTESTQDGWTLEPAELAFQRRNPDFNRLTESQFARVFGHWKSKVEISFADPGAGIVSEPRVWPYCRLRMPSVAPEGHYERTMSFEFSTRTSLGDGTKEPGFFLRTRTQATADGAIASAHYAKIVGPIRYFYDELSFIYYYNAKADDRGLELAPDQNQLKWDKSRPLAEQSQFGVNDP
jgi:hypothetical protein